MAVFHRKNLERIREREQAQRQERRHTILLVDDEPANLRTLSTVLENDYELLTANNGQEALELLDDHEEPERISLIISDQRMPRMTGVELFERVSEKLPDTIRIILTGFIDVDAIIDSINKANIYKFILKPYDRDDLKLTVKRAIEAYEMRRALDDHIENLEHMVDERTRELNEKNAELEEALERVREASRTDPLTGLRNRRYLADHIEADLALSDRRRRSDDEEHADLVFFLIDIDHFKAVNDEYGHGAGDAMLREFAKVLHDCFRESDILVRWGGEEFLAISRFIDRAEASEIAERIRASVEAHEFELPEGQRIEKTCSLGFAAYPFVRSAPEAVSWERIVDVADAAMYAAKRSGRNAWVGVAADDPELGEEQVAQFISSPAETLEANGFKAVSSLGAESLRWA
ncbi:MAG: diguanylate cyclase [Xanthomonadales bacterium]|nr:diguanylate cyclase [Xanthomonadales bacterium]